MRFIPQPISSEGVFSHVVIIAEIFNHLVFQGLIQPRLHFEEMTVNAMFVLFSIAVDGLSLVLPIIIYSKIIDDKRVVVATMYLEFVLQDRFALIISKDALSYIIVYVIALFILSAMHMKDIEYIATHIDSLNWKPVLHYNIALLAVLDTCYGAYYLFEELRSPTINIPIIWLDAVVVVSCLFAAGFSKLNVVVSQEHDNKIEYMRKFQENQSDLIRDFATISEAKSGETGQHIRRVSEYTAILAKQLLDNETDST